MYHSLTGCNVLNIGDILMLQKEHKALDEYILIASTTVTFNCDAHIKKTCVDVSHLHQQKC